MTEATQQNRYDVLICDDSALVRLFLKAIIEDDPELRVTAMAKNGYEAIDLARIHQPDVITMDIDMPGLDGMSALRMLVDEKIAPVVMISSLTEEGAGTTLEALEIGAFDFLPKPQGKAYYGQAELIVSKLKAAARSKHPPPRYAEPHAVQQLDVQVAQYAPPANMPSFIGVAIGASTGGPKALIELVAKLPADLDAALFVVQHMPRTFIGPFTRRLASRTPLKCCVGEEGQVVERGTIYVAQGETHMTLARHGQGELRIHHSREPKTLFIPSVNVTMNSVAECFGPRSVGVILTGMGNDGAQGILAIRQQGGRTIAESPKSAVVYGMPQEAVKLGGVLASLPLPDIPERLIQFVNEGQRQ